MENLLIIGAGSQARYVIDIVSLNKSYRIMGAVDLESGKTVGKRINKIKVICKVDEVPQRFLNSKIRIVVAHGDYGTKKKTVEYLKAQGFKFAQIISSQCYISPYASTSEGCIINPNAVIMPNAKIGKHVIIHSQTVIEHDNVIGDYSNIAPGVSLGGSVTVGEGSYIYTGASVIPKVKIGNNCVIGAGSVVIRDVNDNEVVAGAPAKRIKLNKKGIQGDD